VSQLGAEILAAIGSGRGQAIGRSELVARLRARCYSVHERTVREAIKQLRAHWPRGSSSAPTRRCGRGDEQDRELMLQGKK
jgi:DNA-binding response OmpR family regulator